jgi:hypothetical protein
MAAWLIAVVLHCAVHGMFCRGSIMGRLVCGLFRRVRIARAVVVPVMMVVIGRSGFHVDPP